MRKRRKPVVIDKTTGCIMKKFSIKKFSVILLFMFLVYKRLVKK